MTPQATDRQPARRGRFWTQPIERLARRRVANGRSQPQPESPIDEGEDLLRRLREAGL